MMILTFKVSGLAGNPDGKCDGEEEMGGLRGSSPLCGLGFLSVFGSDRCRGGTEG